MLLAFVFLCSLFGTSFASERVVISPFSPTPTPTSSSSSSPTFSFTSEERHEASKLLVEIPRALKEFQAYHQRFKAAEQGIIDSLGEFAMALSLPDEDPEKEGLVKAAEEVIFMEQVKADAASRAMKNALTDYTDIITENEGQAFKRQRR